MTFETTCHFKVLKTFGMPHVITGVNCRLGFLRFIYSNRYRFVFKIDFMIGKKVNNKLINTIFFF